MPDPVLDPVPDPGPDPGPGPGPGETVDLRVDGTPVATYVWGGDLPQGVAPRPYLHPVRTLAGVELTALRPSAFRHHLGVSVAVADVGGHNFWGGRTFLDGHGPTWLDNHGTQAHEGWDRLEPGRLEQRLSWLTRDGVPLLGEERTVAALPAGPGRWVLELGFTLTNAGARPLPIASPACAGRSGAGYGGFFWRLPTGVQGVRTTVPGDGSGTRNGVVAPWLGVAGHDPAGRPWTLVFVPGDDRTAADPWFVRSRDYTGIGSALAWDRPLELAPGERLTRCVRTVLADGHPDAADLADAVAP